MEHQRGFTLLRLLAVLATMAILSAILFPQICQSNGAGVPADQSAAYATTDMDR